MDSLCSPKKPHKKQNQDSCMPDDGLLKPHLKNSTCIIQLHQPAAQNHFCCLPIFHSYIHGHQDLSLYKYPWNLLLLPISSALSQTLSPSLTRFLFSNLRVITHLPGTTGHVIKYKFFSRKWAENIPDEHPIHANSRHQVCGAPSLARKTDNEGVCPKGGQGREL